MYLLKCISSLYLLDPSGWLSASLLTWFWLCWKEWQQSSITACWIPLPSTTRWGRHNPVGWCKLPFYFSVNIYIWTNLFTWSNSECRPCHIWYMICIKIYSIFSISIHNSIKVPTVLLQLLPLSYKWVLTRSTWLRLAPAFCPSSTPSCLLSPCCGASSTRLTTPTSQLLPLLPPLPTSTWAPLRYTRQHVFRVFPYKTQ